MDEALIEYRQALTGDLTAVEKFLTPFMNGSQLLPRTTAELELLLKHGFIAEQAGQVVGFAAVEVYSRKMAEIQCLAVSQLHQRRGIGRVLVNQCVQRAKELKIVEVMAISSSEDLFRACGFDYALPNQKRALFVQPEHLADSAPEMPLADSVKLQEPAVNPHFID